MAEADFLKKVNKLSGGEFPLVLLDITHPDLSETIRIVNDNEPLTSNGNEYQALNFRITFLPQPDGSSPTAQLSIDNVGNILTDWVNVSYGGRGTTATFGAVLRSNPDEYEVPQVDVNITSITITPNEITATMAPKDLVNLRINPVVYSQQTARGLY